MESEPIRRVCAERTVLATEARKTRVGFFTCHRFRIIEMHDRQVPFQPQLGDESVLTDTALVIQRLVVRLPHVLLHLTCCSVLPVADLALHGIGSV